MTTRTDHSIDIANLRRRNEVYCTRNNSSHDLVDQAMRLAADLLEMHDATGISLDRWPAARESVENWIGHPITPNGV